MKKIFYCLPLVASIFLVGCGEDFLTKDNLYQKNSETYYSTEAEVVEALRGVYMPLTNCPTVYSDEPVAANALSDMLLGGGGASDYGIQYIDNFTDPNEDTYLDFWKESYNGITRANFIIENVPSKDFKADFKNQAVGEAYFMRGYYHFRLAKMFGGIPLITSTSADRAAARSSYTDTYAQIAADFKMAADMMPATKFGEISQDDFGRANKWIAEGYLTRAYLYYTGYMTNIENVPTTTLPVAGGAALTNADIAVYINDCAANSGYYLVSDFRNLWPYSGVNAIAAANGSTKNPVLPWAETEGLAWVGQDGAKTNTEVMFAIRYNIADWTMGQQYSNGPCLYWGLRGISDKSPFGPGWGMARVNSKLWAAYEPTDKRRDGSILDLTGGGKEEQGTAGYNSTNNDQTHETYYAPKKYIGIQFPSPNPTQMFWAYYGKKGSSDYMLNQAQDYILLRYADILLMQSEILGDAVGINLVRARAGVAPVASYSLDVLKKERMLELEQEGLRYFDIVRWGDVVSAFSASVDVENGGKAASYNANYRPETKGLFPIPEHEIRLSNGVYTQNPGWE